MRERKKERRGTVVFFEEAAFGLLGRGDAFDAQLELGARLPAFGSPHFRFGKWGDPKADRARTAAPN